MSHLIRCFAPFSFVAPIVLAAIVGCSSSSSTSTPSGSPPKGTWSAGGTTNLKGTYATSTTSGSLDLTVNSTYTAVKGGDAGTTPSASGSLFAGGVVIPLTGSFDPVTGDFSVSGGGYTLTGKMTAAGISGTITTPSGKGGFFLIAGGATAYCGTFSGGDHGTWTFTTNATGGAIGGYTNSKGDIGGLVGFVSGGSVTLNPDKGGAGATGTISATSASGTWSTADGKATGAWTGAVCN